MSKTQLRDVSAGAYCKVRTGRAIWSLQACGSFITLGVLAGESCSAAPWRELCFSHWQFPGLRGPSLHVHGPLDVRVQTTPGQMTELWSGRWLSRGHPAAQQTCVLDPDFWTLGSEL